jgi:hypothetical protein
LDLKLKLMDVTEKRQWVDDHDEELRMIAGGGSSIARRLQVRFAMTACLCVNRVTDVELPTKTKAACSKRRMQSFSRLGLDSMHLQEVVVINKK